MKTVRALSIIALACFLILQGLYFLAELTTPTVHAAIGLLGLGAGVLMYISLRNWIDHHKEK